MGSPQWSIPAKPALSLSWRPAGGGGLGPRSERRSSLGADIDRIWASLAVAVSSPLGFINSSDAVLKKGREFAMVFSDEAGDVARRPRGLFYWGYFMAMRIRKKVIRLLSFRRAKTEDGLP